MKLLLLLLSSLLLSNSHDVTTLPAWGPYSKHYAGISHVGNVESGARVDFFVAQGFYRRSEVFAPNCLYESNCFPWKVSSDMRHIQYRQMVEWKDQVYVDVTYHVLDEAKVLVEMNCVNNTDIPQSVLLHTVANAAFAESYPVVEAVDAKAVVYARDYDQYIQAVPTYDRHLVYDGQMLGEKGSNKSLCGKIIITSGNVGDVLRYTLPSLGEPVKMRCMLEKDALLDLSVNGMVVSIHGTGEWELVTLPFAGTALELQTVSAGVLSIDSFLLGKAAAVKQHPLNYSPTLSLGDGYFIVKYDDIPDYYGLGWNFPVSDVNTYISSNISTTLKTKSNKHVDHYFNDGGDIEYTSAFQRPVMLDAKSDTTIWNLITKGKQEEVKRTLTSFKEDETSFTSKVRSFSNADNKILPVAEPYERGARILQATVLTNVVYPVYTQKQYIRHFTPGKNWNSLYTWDSGVISLALGKIDRTLAFETLRAYTTEQGCQSAFIHHGTPLPIQFFAFEELMSDTGDTQWMEFLYPRMMQYLGYMLGWDGTSSTVMNSGLLRTWDYFYNSGGWDDYPPQVYVSKHGNENGSIAPVVSSAYYIRAAKILRLAAQRLGKKDDVKKLDKAIDQLSKAILDNAWDEETGYFGYVTHDRNGKAQSILRYDDGTNYNMGLDGISPLVAGIGSADQKAGMLDNLFSDKHLWTPYGISTVDKSASYYRIDGYWNGCIWMPHQYFQWKAMLDLGLTERASQIAMTALKTWSDEVDTSYQCYEHFLVGTGRGCGWHNFSGLSSIVINWFDSYFRKGSLSTGFDTMVCSQKWNEDNSSVEAELMFDKDAIGNETCVLLCLDPSYRYAAAIDGKEVALTSPYDGLVYVKVMAGVKPVHLVVKATSRIRR